MGNILDVPITEKEISRFEFLGKQGVVVSMQGWRIRMEDAHITEPTLRWNSEIAFFGVFDGHGGAATSSFCRDNLLTTVQEQVSLSQIQNPTEEDYAAVLRKSFILFDSQIKESNISPSGSTAICGFVTPTHYIISNLGDSRCVLCRNGSAQPLSVDHKPALEAERRRICTAGGFVMNNRVNGELAVSRAFGDFSYKKNESIPAEEQQVSCEPDVRIIRRDEHDNYLIFACDGIWDVFSNPDTLIPVVNQLIKSYETLEEAISRLLDICLERGSKDNMTFMIVPLNEMPTSDPKAVEERKKIEEERKKKVEDNSIAK